MGTTKRARAVATASKGAQEQTRQILDSIRQIVQSLRVAERAAERMSGLSGAQIFVLQKLADGQAASLNELAARTLTHQSSVSVVVQKLVQRKLIARNASRDDARRIVLGLTPAGRAMLRASPRAPQDRLIDAVGRLSAKDRRELARLLGSVAADAASHDHQQLPPPMLFEDANGGSIASKKSRR